MKLNRDRPFATIIGQSENGAMFQQGGYDFDNHGDQVVPFTVDTPSPIGVTLPEPTPDIVEQPVKATAHDVKQWTKTAVINHMKMKFPGVYVNESEKIFVLKNQLRALYATD